ncbi:dTDP-glucose 4,6-dehydratase/UDP-glucuronate decarboxylase [Neobacillus bataviensis]|uniref:dTDP-glucose 4,6-dehydratase/UDP-glucuronate decarboxylase n=1 Tax=Neobacillus bataviensis TaxID=220685 RepID=A0A561CZ03_9BACI|nr:NAD-dependent epimerase/dehydratase family protein [Neobacillus bataviensis]TWD96461.1 dTDP-glucose 4,6-dehydratase/UDP-glucuronate decarboxylase [Neobacillus bataviensis]
MLVKLSNVIKEDIKELSKEIEGQLKKLEGSRVLISGGGGFLGGYFLDLIDYCNQNIFETPCNVICIENFISAVPQRIQHLQNNQYFEIVNQDIVQPLNINKKVDYIIHAASIASPTYYRKYPIETIETNVMGLKNLLDFGKEQGVKSFLFFSTSEIYGNPAPEFIPTPETYNGNVSCTGPRACYDESKRLGETLCVIYFQQYGVPVKVVRPFNVYGPGLRIDDKRVIPDFFNDALHHKKISLFSNGAPTRSFCYISDAIKGFMLALLSNHDGEAFNIGNDEVEISMLELAKLVGKLVGGVEIEFKQSNDDKYLIDNPQRRCPNLTKAKNLLGYYPKVNLEDGLGSLKDWYEEVYMGEYEK